MAQALAEKLEYAGPAEKERVVSVPQREQLESTPEPPFPRGEETEPSARVPNHKREKVKVGESRILVKERRSEREHEKERVGRFQGEEGDQAKKASLGDVQGSMSGRMDAKALQEICRVLVSLQSGQT